MSVVMWVTVLILGLATVLGLLRVVTAQDDASRAGVGDLVYFATVSLFVVVAMAAGSSVVFDVSSLAALVGILATVAFARILTRGRR